jgi:hypothetical protein
MAVGQPELDLGLAGLGLAGGDPLGDHVFADGSPMGHLVAGVRRVGVAGCCRW